MAPQRVAVIAVHGVGSPPADETARDVAELLVRSAPEGISYDRFEERRITVPTNPLYVGETRTESGLRRFMSAFTRNATDRTQLGTTKEVAERPDIAFTRNLLLDYSSPRKPYQTVELVGQRRDAKGAATDVHVFEVHWADLSRLSSGFVKFFGSLYQLVQHVSQIGRTSVDVAGEVARAREEFKLGDSDPGPGAGPAKGWTMYGWLNAWAIRCFTVLVPVATLLMLTFALLFLPAAVPESWRLVAGVTLFGLVLTVGVGLAIYFGPADRQSASFFAVFMLAIVGLAIATATAPDHDTGVRLGNILLDLAAILMVVALYLAAVRSYNKSRSGAFAFGAGGLALVIIVTLWTARVLDMPISIAGPEGIRQLGFVAFQWSYLVLLVTWGIMWVAVVLAVAVRTGLWSRLSGRARDRAARIAWTSRTTLASTVFGYIVVLLVAYRSAVFLAEKAVERFSIFPIPIDGQLPLLNFPGYFPSNFACDPRSWESLRMCAGSYLARMIGQSATSGFVIALLGLAASFALASWFVALIAATSVKTPDPKAGNSRRLGLWMFQGFVWTRAAGTVLAMSMLLAILTGILIDYSPPFRDWLMPLLPHWLRHRMTPAWATDLIDRITIAVLASAATIGAARVRVQSLAAKARPAIGIMLDIDNYLRETPWELTPRARIVERFVSLLRHVEAQKFDRVVLVSHSQGTVITTDLLRFLSLGGVSKADAALVTADRYRLLTMGSPLRQLYGANFPHLYAWVTASDPDPDKDRTTLTAAQTPDIAQKSPDPAQLKVSEWVNLYTSGDYVGRNLWADDDWEGVWDQRAEAIAKNGRRERCLGAGTHTHYWTSEDAAAEIDRLIAS